MRIGDRHADEVVSFPRIALVFDESTEQVRRFSSAHGATYSITQDIVAPVSTEPSCIQAGSTFVRMLTHQALGECDNSKAQVVRTHTTRQHRNCRTARRHRRTGRERPSATARKPVLRVGEGGRSRPHSLIWGLFVGGGGGTKRRPISIMRRPSSHLQTIEPEWLLSPPETALGPGSCEVRPPPLATTGGDNSPPASCLPVCLPNSRVHDVPTREERWRYGRPSTCASKRPAPRVMASASAGELVASMTLPPSRNQAR